MLGAAKQHWLYKYAHKLFQIAAIASLSFLALVGLVALVGNVAIDIWKIYFHFSGA